ncbi:MAG: hypothetical protein EOO43_26985 [Flavobacterium sp.]|nr:MAG: hypothetical protein EOO43_26985 [Flavobacterium sp.]
MKIYVTSYWTDDFSLYQSIKRLGFGEARWKNLEFTIDRDFDRVIVLNGTNMHSHPFRPNKAIYFRLEPPDSSNYLKDASEITIPGFIHWPFWEKIPKDQMLDIQSMNSPQKTELLSTVTSDLAYMEGHFQRLMLIHLLDQKFVKNFDVWGRNTGSNFFPNIKSYKGELVNKYDGLLKYAYHLSVENSFIPDYFTEKITDAILSECLCFYAGCTNIEEYIDERAFVKIDILDKEDCAEVIITTIRNELWQKNLPFIKQQKRRFMNELNPLNLFWMVANEYDYEIKLKL